MKKSSIAVPVSQELYLPYIPDLGIFSSLLPFSKVVYYKFATYYLELLNLNTGFSFSLAEFDATR